MSEHGERWALVFAMFMVLATVFTFGTCLRAAAYNIAHSVTYQDIFQLRGIPIAQGR
jgi:cell division protein FtsX